MAHHVSTKASPHTTRSDPSRSIGAEQSTGAASESARQAQPRLHHGSKDGAWAGDSAYEAASRPVKQVAAARQVSAGGAITAVGLRPADFTVPLSVATLRATDPQLSDAEFRTKLKAASVGAGNLIRAFPRGYYRDLHQLPAGRIIGGIGIGCGDAHPHNFGFVHVGHHTIFGLTDFDDSGYEPVALDAAHFFAVVSCTFGDPALTARLIQQYVHILRHPEDAVAVDPKLAPSWKKLAEKHLAKYTDGDRFRLDKKTGLVALGHAERRDIASAAMPLLPAGSKILDIAQLPRMHGGSAGMLRYWLLTKTPEGRSVLELKQMAEPGVRELDLPHPIPMEKRLGVLQKVFWHGHEAFSTPAKIDGHLFLLRDCSALYNPHSQQLAPKTRDHFLSAEVSLMANAHRQAWGDTNSAVIESWLTESVQTLAQRWEGALKACREQLKAEK